MNTDDEKIYFVDGDPPVKRITIGEYYERAYALKVPVEAATELAHMML